MPLPTAFSTTLRLDGKVALVTGAGRGLGAAYAHLLAERGAAVVVNDPGVGISGEGSDRMPAQGVAEAIRSAGHRAVANFDSVATVEGAQAMVEQAVTHFGGLDIVVNNAGTFMERHPFSETTAQTYRVIWDVHVTGTINVIRSAWPFLLQRGGGRIINSTSHAGYLGSRHNVEYATAKGAVHGLTRTLSIEAGEVGIAVNAIAPAALTRPVAWANQAITDAVPPGAMSADLVAPTLVWMAHESCTANGEVFAAGAGATSRVLVMETTGYFNPRPAPEDILAHAGLVRGEDVLASLPLRLDGDAESRGAASIRRWIEAADR